jgi:HEAT repeat protein
MLGDEGAKQFAIIHLDSTSLETVSMAILALGRYSNEAKIRILLDEALGSPHREVRYSAALSLYDRSAKAIPILEEEISNESNPLHLRMQLVFTVGESPFPEADASLKRLTALRHKEVSDLAKYVIERRAERPSDRFR